MKIRNEYTRPLELVHDIIKGKWKTIIIFQLKVEYFLTKRGRKMLSAIMIMQELGIEYMVEYGMTEFLDKKGISYQDIHTKK